MISLLQAKASLYYVDTDCVMFSLPKNIQNPLEYSSLLGSFKSVIDPQCTIKSFYCLGNRNYCILYENQNKVLKSVIKVKGLSLTSSHLKNTIDSNTYQVFLNSYFKKEFKKVRVPQKKLKCKKILI